MYIIDITKTILPPKQRDDLLGLGAQVREQLTRANGAVRLVGQQAQLPRQLFGMEVDEGGLLNARVSEDGGRLGFGGRYRREGGGEVGDGGLDAGCERLGESAVRSAFHLPLESTTQLLCGLLESLGVITAFADVITSGVTFSIDPVNWLSTKSMNFSLKSPSS